MTGINYVVGDATEPTGEGPKIIAHVCNDIGLWGAGFVLALSKKWPQPERIYRLMHERSQKQWFDLGTVQFVNVAENICVASIIGQHGVRSKTNPKPIDYNAVRMGLDVIRRTATLDHINMINKPAKSVHMPRIGCGLAGGNWGVIEPIINSTLCAYGVPVTVYDLP